MAPMPTHSPLSCMREINHPELPHGIPWLLPSRTTSFGRPGSLQPRGSAEPRALLGSASPSSELSPTCGAAVGCGWRNFVIKRFAAATSNRLASYCSSCSKLSSSRALTTYSPKHALAARRCHSFQVGGGLPRQGQEPASLRYDPWPRRVVRLGRRIDLKAQDHGTCACVTRSDQREEFCLQRVSVCVVPYQRIQDRRTVARGRAALARGRVALARGRAEALARGRAA